MKETIGFSLNGKPVSFEVDSHRILLWVTMPFSAGTALLERL